MAIMLASMVAAAAALLPCSSSLDCSLNGMCTAGVCVCDRPWKDARTEACSVLDVEPHPDAYIPAYGGPRTSTAYQKQNLTSWGGNILLADDGKYHLFVSAMDGGVGLRGWGSISRIDHAVADDPMGVFELVDTPLRKEAHNASPLRAKNGSYLLFHIGSSGDSSKSNPVAPPDSFSPIGRHVVLAGGGSSFAHHAETPDGPWYPLSGPRCNNPAPMLANNGTAFVGCNDGGFHIYKSDDVFAGKWTQVTTMAFPPSWGANAPSYLKNEDPYLWMDRRGNFHLLAHRYDYRDGYPPNPNQTMPLHVSGHGFSTDGVAWHFNVEQQPYDALIRFHNGTTQQFSTYERPHLVFDPESGLPTHLVNGVQPYWMGPDGPCDGCDRRAGSMHSCVVCKTTEGIDYTYTLVSKLNVDA